MNFQPKNPLFFHLLTCAIGLCASRCATDNRGSAVMLSFTFLCLVQCGILVAHQSVSCLAQRLF